MAPIPVTLPVVGGAVLVGILALSAGISMVLINRMHQRAHTKSDREAGVGNEAKSESKAPAAVTSPYARDSVLYAMVTQFTLSYAGKPENTQQTEVMQATTCLPDLTDDMRAPPDSQLFLRDPDCIQGHLPVIHEERSCISTHATDLATPTPSSIPANVPDIVIVPPPVDDHEVPATDSLLSIYSQDSGRKLPLAQTDMADDAISLPLDLSLAITSPGTHPIPTFLSSLTKSVSVAHLATDVSFYFPASPSPSDTEYLQIPQRSSRRAREPNEDAPLQPPSPLGSRQAVMSPRGRRTSRVFARPFFYASPTPGGGFELSRVRSGSPHHALR